MRIQSINSVENQKEGQGIHFKYIQDGLTDSYQIGRSLCKENDITIEGPLHVCTKKQKICGTVSRHACRMVCERYPPYRCYLDTSHFYSNKVRIMKDSFRRSAKMRASSDKQIRIWSPETKIWRKIESNRENFPIDHDFKSSGTSGEIPQHSLRISNELLDNCMVDISGVVLLFRKPQSVTCREMINSRKVIEELNALQPTCPVHMHTLQIQYEQPQSREYKIQRKKAQDIARLYESKNFGEDSENFTQPIDERQPFVFTACGHVHGYSKSLETRPCPLCRTIGPYVPLSFTFEPLIDVDAQSPTHVFNPCGHVASEKCCLYWSKISIPAVGVDFNNLAPTCPFCRTPLSKDPGPLYSRLRFTFNCSPNP